MSSTRKDIQAQLEYMRKNKTEYLKNITIEEYKNRIKILKEEFHHRRINSYE
jgi:hypothetical protein